MKKLEFQLPMFIATVSDHTKIKKEILQKINETPHERIHDEEQSISKTDWTIPAHVYRPYMDTVYPYIDSFLIELSKEFYKEKSVLKLDNYWFQQYEKGDFHNWHRHKGCFACVYYIELPTGSSFTTFNIQDKEISIPVEEGQIIAFLGGIEHQSKPNPIGRKTVIAFNTA
jgi:hypothetical protein